MFRQKFKQLCARKGVSPSAVAESLGYTRTAASGWVNGKEPKPATLQRIAEYFGVDIDYFIDEETPVAPVVTSAYVMMPIIGAVKAGYGGDAQEEYTGDYKVVTDLGGYPPEECRLLNVRGDSMYPLLMDGDTVLVHIQPTVENGQVAVVLQEDEATLKRVKMVDGEMELIPENREYKVRKIKGAALLSVRIYGRVISVIHRSI